MAYHCAVYLTIYTCPRGQIHGVLDVLAKYDISNDDDSPNDQNSFQLGAMHWNYDASADAANNVAAELMCLPGVAFAVFDEPEDRSESAMGTSVLYTPTLGRWRRRCDRGGEEMFTAAEIAKAVAAGTLDRMVGQPWRQALAATLPDPHAAPVWAIAPVLHSASWVVREHVVEISPESDGDGPPTSVPVEGEKEADARSALAVAGWSVTDAPWTSTLRGRAYELEVFRTAAG